MFHFNAPIIKRRKIKKLNLLTGMAAAGLLGYFLLTFLDLGMIPVIERLINQLGFIGYINWIYLALLIGLLIPVLSTLRMFSGKKVKVGGEINFDEETLSIKRGKEEFIIPEADLTEVNFELKALPSGDRKKEGQLFGGNYMRIPTKKGTFVVELDLNTPIQREKLMEMAEFLKIQHDVVVKVKEKK